MTGTLARHVWYVQALRRDAQIGCGNVMDHVAASALAAVIVARRLIALAVGRAVIVDEDAVLVLLLLLMSHVAVRMHVLIQVIMVEMIMMMTVCSIRRDVRRREIAVMVMVA